MGNKQMSLAHRISNMIISEPRTSFGDLPTEVLLSVFDYLTSNDIIYTFYSVNGRFRNLLAHHGRYLSHYELPTSNTAFWQTVLPSVGPHVRTLTVPTPDLPLSLDVFANLTAVVITSPYGLSDRSLQVLFANRPFLQLRTFKVTSNTFLRPRSSLLRDNAEHYFFSNIFHERNQLREFAFLSRISLFSRKTLTNFETNSHLSSLTLRLNEFRDVFAVLRYTPNLLVLNVATALCFVHQNRDQSMNTRDYKLQKLALTFARNDPDDVTDPTTYLHLLSDLKLFSSTLTRLSLNFINLNVASTDELPFNGLKLQHQLLKSMLVLDQFHLYAKARQLSIDAEGVLSTFTDRFWLDRRWFVATHGSYLYTVPFHFHELRGFIDFNCVRSTNATLLADRTTWRNAKMIELAPQAKFDMQLIKLMKIRLPALQTIRFLASGLYSYSKSIDHLRTASDVVLPNVTTVELVAGSVENIKQWLVNALPNVQHLILSYTELPLSSSQLAPLLATRIRRVDAQEHYTAAQVSSNNHDSCFANLDEIRLTLFNVDGKYSWYVDVVKSIFERHERLKRLWICLVDQHNRATFHSSEVELIKIIEYLQMNGLLKDYRAQRHRESALFISNK